MTKTNKKLVALVFLATAILPAGFAQIINKNADPYQGGAPDRTTLYIVLGAVAVVLVGGFLFFRSKGK